jgi:hypothetical protein
MKKYTIKYYLLFSIFLLIVVIIITINISFLTIELKEHTNQKIILQKIVKPGDIFSLKYTHSVAQTPVWEIFKITDKGGLILIETYFSDHGAGLPYTNFENEIFIKEDNKFKIKNMSREIELPLYYRVGEIRENYFIFQQEEINLSKMLGNSVATIDIVQINLFNYLLKYLVG